MNKLKIKEFCVFANLSKMTVFIVDEKNGFSVKCDNELYNYDEPFVLVTQKNKKRIWKRIDYLIKNLKKYGLDFCVKYDLSVEKI